MPRLLISAFEPQFSSLCVCKTLPRVFLCPSPKHIFETASLPVVSFLLLFPDKGRRLLNVLVSWYCGIMHRGRASDDLLSYDRTEQTSSYSPVLIRTGCPFKVSDIIGSGDMAYWFWLVQSQRERERIRQALKRDPPRLS